jgi:hypothetical protein
MELTVAERITLQAILPTEEDFTTLKLTRKLRELLGFDEQEYQEIGFKQEYQCPKCQNALPLPAPIICGKCGEWMQRTGRVVWSSNPLKNFEFGEIATELIKKQLRILNENKKLKEEQFTLYALFVGEN